jgi:hypothetical protein
MIGASSVTVISLRVFAISSWLFNVSGGPRSFRIMQRNVLDFTVASLVEIDYRWN